MLNEGVHFEIGNIALAEGAVRAGCRFYAGYPITPSSEVMERMSQILPIIGGKYIQMEDELASISAVIGASLAGLKSMTATSGPGFSLMQENLGYAYFVEVPLVLVVAQRAGPSTGLATKPAQQEFYQSRYGTHGDYEAIVITPSTVQEMFDLIIRAFNLSETFRQPVIFLTDGELAHVREKFVIPPIEEIEVVERQDMPEGKKPYPLDPTELGWVPHLGKGRNLLVTGSGHDEVGFRTADKEIHEKRIQRLKRKVLDNIDIIKDFDFIDNDGNILFISYGISSRTTLGAVKKLKSEGVKANMLRLKTLWPLADKDIKKYTDNADTIVTVEMNAGQLNREIERISRKDVYSIGVTGGVVPSTRLILKKVKKII